MLIVHALGLRVPASAQKPAAAARERVTFKSGDLTLVGFLCKPDGTGSLPGVIWNHGSQKNPGTQRQFVEEGGWATPRGGKAPNAGVASACAEELVKIKT